MKRLLSVLIICAVALSASYTSNAQIKFGIKGGLNLTNLSGSAVKDVKNIFSTYTGFHGGLALNIGLPLGFAIQPEVLYSQNGVKINPEILGQVGAVGAVSASIASGAIQVPIGIQWGIELGPVRPFVQAVPYISFPVAHMVKAKVAGQDINVEEWNDMFKSFDYGAGLGIGVDVWKIQVSAKYNWSFGSYVKSDTEQVNNLLEDLSLDDTKLSGFELSLGIFF